MKGLDSIIPRTIQALLALLIILSASQQSLAAPLGQAMPTILSGPFEVSSAEYKFPASVDPEVLNGIETEMWARVFRPKVLDGKHPILFFLHGNHRTCGHGENPRIDDSCQYTFQGTCEEGSRVVPNHEGYNYVAEKLASLGYIVVSINANRGITCNSGGDDDSGLNLARGKLILKHLATWYKWSTVGGAPASLGIPANGFQNAIDFSNVGLMGHSRGGEGVRAAYNIYRDPGSIWPTKIPGLRIKGIFEIGAVDGQTSRILDADDVAWNQLLPMCDGDVADLEGRKPFERMLYKPKEAVPSAKSLLMVWGANHNSFNTEWQTSESEGCFGHEALFTPAGPSTKQQDIATAAMVSFFRGHVGEHSDTHYAQAFNPLFSVPNSIAAITRVDRDYSVTNDSFFSLRVDDFDKPDGKSSSNATNDANGVTVINENTKLPKRALVSWQPEAGNPQQRFFQSNLTEANSGRDLRAMKTLDFRVTQAPQAHTGDKKANAGQNEDDNLFGNDVGDDGVDADLNDEPVSFSVALVDAQDRISTVLPMSNYVKLNHSPNELNVVYQTVRIPLRDFGDFDLSQVRGVRFVFDQTAKGAIYLVQLRFTSTFEDINTNPPVLASLGKTPMLLHGPIHISGNGEAVAKIHSFFGHTESAKAIANSPHLMGGLSGVEITVQAGDAGHFPLTNALPVLKIGDEAFKVSRCPNFKKSDRLIFTIPRSEYTKLQDGSTMQVQFGTSNHPNRLWKLSNFSKTSFAIE